MNKLKSRPKPAARFYGSSSSYHWVNDPFSNELPYKRKGKKKETEVIVRELRNDDKPKTKGRAKFL